MSGPDSVIGYGVDGTGVDGTGEVVALSMIDDVARALRADVHTAQALVETVVAEAVRIVPGADEAGVIVAARGGGLQVVATTSPDIDAIDALQHRLDDGPCLLTARGQVVVHVPDLTTEHRWPEFARAAAAQRFASMLCLPLRADDHTLGTLTLYSRTQDAFDASAEAVARVLATLAALSLADTHRTENLRRALESRDLIGQAKGVLMVTHGVTAEAAFAMLAKHSQDTNVKLAALAAQVAETGALPA